MKKFEVVESIGDVIEADVDLNSGQRAVIGKLQNAQLELQAKQEEFSKFIEQVKEAEEKVAKIKESVYEIMRETGAKSIESDYLKITIVNPTTRFSIDCKKLEAIDPALFSKVKAIAGKNSPVRGYAKITPKKGA